VYHSRGFGVWRRGLIYQFRVRVPHDVRAVIGRTHISRSLKTDSLTVANRLAAQCALEATATFNRARQAATVNLLEGINCAATEQTVSFEELCARYLSDPAASRTAKSLHAYRSSLSMLVEIVGASTPSSAVDRAACRDVMNVLSTLPPNARKRWPDVPLREVARTAVGSGERAMSAANVNEHMNKLSTVLNWGIKEDLCAANSAKGLRLPYLRSAKDRRSAFSATQLQRIFDAPLYRGCVDDERRYSMVGDNRPRRSRFWVPLLSLFGVLRLNEACQLLVADVREDRGVLCIHVSSEGDAQSLKTAASKRLVPVHSELLEIGLRDYVRSARTKGQVRLFDEIKLDSFGMHSGGFSRWFARFLVTCDAAAARTCFHSFRHSFRDALRNAGVSREVALALGGWSAPSGFSAVGDAYGSGFDPRVLQTEVEKIRYPDLDLSHLKVV
jgi:integrase